MRSPTAHHDDSVCGGVSIAQNRRYLRLERVCLTFGDGPSPWTPQIQDVLERESARATFFMCGKRAQFRPDLVRRAAAQGHRIGCHAWSHRRLSCLTSREVEEELRSSVELLEDIIGAKVTTFLAPYCESDERAARVAQELGMKHVECATAIDPRDWEEPGAQELVYRVQRAVTEGVSADRVLLLHDGRADDLPTTTDLVEDRSQTLQALPEMIACLRRHGVSLQLL